MTCISWKLLQIIKRVNLHEREAEHPFICNCLKINFRKTRVYFPWLNLKFNTGLYIIMGK